jgi:methyltransferase family protein
MRPGQIARRLLGPRLTRVVGRTYRKLFVDLGKLSAALSPWLPHQAHVLDIGGGDGEPLNYLLAIRPDLRITTLDLQSSVGEWLDVRFQTQVTRLPGTSLADYVISGRPDPDVILVADVLHHIPADARPGFFKAMNVLLDRVPQLRILVKDVEPGSWRATLGLLSDRYVTGDRTVSLLSRADLRGVLEGSLGPLQARETSLFEMDRPNYAIVFFR